MADFYDDIDGQGAAGGPDVPIINGGLLDPRTFPSNLPSRLPMLEGSTPAEPAPDHHVFDAEVERDIQRARAALPPLAPPPAGGLRHIDAYPGMNYVSPIHPHSLTLDGLRNFIDGIAIPDYGPHITFVNDDPKNPSPDRPVRNALANLVEHGVVDSGFHSVNVNSTVGGHPGSHGNHPPGYAVDINNIDGFRVVNRPDWRVPCNRFLPASQEFGKIMDLPSRSKQRRLGSGRLPCLKWRKIIAITITSAPNDEQVTQASSNRRLGKLVGSTGSWRREMHHAFPVRSKAHFRPAGLGRSGC